MEEIKELKQKLVHNSKLKSEACENAIGDGWHDNFDFEDAKREEFKIFSDLERKIEGLSRIVLINVSATEDRVDINDYILVEMIFNDEDPENEKYKLIASDKPNIRGEVKEISISSPLGKIIYGQKEGFVGEYSVKDNSTKVTLKKFGKSLAELENNKKLVR